MFPKRGNVKAGDDIDWWVSTRTPSQDLGLSSLSICLSPFWLAVRYLKVKLCSSGVEGSLRNLDLNSLSLSIVGGMSANNLVLPIGLNSGAESLLAEREEGSLSVIKASLKAFWLSDWSDMMNTRKRLKKMKREIKGLPGNEGSPEKERKSKEQSGRKVRTKTPNNRITPKNRIF